MDFNDQDEFDLTPLIAYNAGFFTAADTLSPEESPEALPELQQRPISKRRGKKRSSRACASCRARKVRCNIVAHGAPCSNCRHDEVDCILPLSRRQKAAKERAEQQNAQKDDEKCPEDDIMHDHDYACHSTNAPPECVESRSHQKILPQLSPPHGMAISDHVLCEILPGHSASQRNSPAPAQTITSQTTVRRKPPRMSWRNIEAPLATSVYSNSAKLPKPFSPLPEHLSSTDISYLAARSAFELPSEALQVALLQAFVEFVHPSLPVLDVDEVLETVKSGKGRKISLLLFQTMMLGGMEYVSDRILKAEYRGRSKADVMATMVERVKLLYDFDTTTDRLTIIQSMLLFSHALSSSQVSRNLPDLHKDAHHYLGLALSLAFSLGIHRTGPPIPQGFPPGVSVTPAMSTMYLSLIRRRKIEKRIWWSLCLQDQLLNLNGSGKRRVNPGDHDVALLELEDFDVFEGSLDTDEEDHDQHIRHTQARTFIEKVQLYRWASQGAASIPQEQTHAQRQYLPEGASTSQVIEDVASTPQDEESTYAYAISNSTSEDLDADCATPQDDHFSVGMSIDPISTQKYVDQVDVVRSVEVDVKFGYGVDGEYDDYLEYL